MEGHLKKIDVISFDPRGVSNKNPTISCFHNEMMSQTWDMQGEYGGYLEARIRPLTGYESQHKAALSQSCATHPSAFANPNDKHIGQYINTWPAIRDIVQVIEKHGECRTQCQKSAFKLRTKRKVRTLPIDFKQRSLEKRRREVSPLGFVLWQFCKPSLCVNASTSSCPHWFWMVSRTLMTTPKTSGDISSRYR